MPYPDAIIQQLAQKYLLSSDLQQQLMETLKIAGMQELLEGEWIIPELLLKQAISSGEWFVLSSIQAQMLVNTYQAIRDHDLIKDKQILFAEMLVWIETQKELYSYIVSPSLAKAMLTQTSLLTELKKVSKEKPEEMQQWATIKVAIEALRKMHFKERKYQSIEINKQVESIRDFLQTNTFLLLEYLEIAKILFTYMNEQTIPLENTAKQYFSQLFQQQNKKIINFLFAPKPTGDQLGKKMLIKYVDGDSALERSISYYIKTHQNGSTSRGSSVKPVDAKELFVYKVFEYIGIGPKAHFFFNILSTGGFFIATQDMSFTKQSDKSKFFHTYEAILKSNELQKDFLKKDEAIYQALSGMDILARIFRLRDVTTNPGNFGCVSINDNRQKWQIIDFIVDSFETYGYDNIFKGFKNGNGMYNYHGFLGEILRDRPEADRIQTGVTVIETLESGRVRHSHENDKKLPLMEAIEKAYAEIVDYISKNGKDIGLEVNPALQDLEQYKKNVIENFITLAANIRSSNAQTSTSTPNV